MSNEIAVLKDGIIKAEAAGYSSADEKRITNALIEMLVPLQYRTIQHYSAYFSTEGLAAAKRNTSITAPVRELQASPCS